MIRLKLGFTAAIAMASLSFGSSGTAQVFLAANVTGRGAYQDTKTVSVNCRTVDGERMCDEVEVDVIKQVAINNKVLINLARGASLTSIVPPNLVLALFAPCDAGTPLLGVYDKSASNIVVTIAEIATGDNNSAQSSKVVCTGVGEERTCEALNTAFEGVVTLTFSSTTNELNAIQGGEARLYVKGTSSPGGCPVTRVAASGPGAVDVMVTTQARDPDTGEIGNVTSNAHVLIQNLTITTGRRLPAAP